MPLSDQLVVDQSRCDSTFAAAGFSPCGGYRWWLKRGWQPQLPPLVFIGLNPSLADAERHDPTLRRIVGFARAWGYGSVTLVNLFARISPSPAALRRCLDPVGVHNDLWLQRALDGSTVWLGWGNHGRWQGRAQHVLALLQAATPVPPLLALGLTAQGQPRHPLYAPAASRPRLVQLPRLVDQGLAQTVPAGAS